LSDLFSGNSPEFPVDRSKPGFAPLAEQLRPQTPDEVIGQQHLLGPASRCASPSHPASRIR
jgi:putative ATPase